MGISNTEHGESYSVEYAAWGGMLRRCYDPDDKFYAEYGGRGISVCDRWRLSFLNFLGDMGRRPAAKSSIDRWPNNDGNYEPGNCRWADAREQANNRRNSRFVEFLGKKQTLAEWARELNLNYGALRTRMDIGWSAEDMLTIPAGPFRENKKVVV